MGTTSINVSVVNVGQGQCTFVEVHGTATLDILLMDCGSNKASNHNVEENLDYMATFLYNMLLPTISCLVLSHSDTDHTNLVEKLIYRIDFLNTMNHTTKQLVIKAVFYGGNFNDYTKGVNKFNILQYIVERNFCNKTNVHTMCANRTNINPATGNPEGGFWESSDTKPEDKVLLFPIISNVLSDFPDFNDDDEYVPIGRNAETKNTVSIVCGLYYKKYIYVICGDATLVTMSAILRYFNTKHNGIHTTPTKIFNNNIMLTLPHHGSRVTTLGVNRGSEASIENIATIKSFSRLLNAQSITISSFQKHRHTSLEVCSLFPPKCKTPALQDFRIGNPKNLHFMVLYDDVGVKKDDDTTIKEGYHNVITTSNIFGTDYYLSEAVDFINMEFSTDSEANPIYGILTTTGELPPINPGACWIFTTLPNGDTSLVGKSILSDSPTAIFTEHPTTTLLKEGDSTKVIRTTTSSNYKLSAIRPTQFLDKLKTFR